MHGITTLPSVSSVSSSFVLSTFYTLFFQIRYYIIIMDNRTIRIYFLVFCKLFIYSVHCPFHAKQKPDDFANTTSILFVCLSTIYRTWLHICFFICTMQSLHQRLLQSSYWKNPEELCLLPALAVRFSLVMSL